MIGREADAEQSEDGRSIILGRLEGSCGAQVGIVHRVLERGERGPHAQGRENETGFPDSVNNRDVVLVLLEKPKQH